MCVRESKMKIALRPLGIFCYILVFLFYWSDSGWWGNWDCFHAVKEWILECEQHGSNTALPLASKWLLGRKLRAACWAMQHSWLGCHGACELLYCVLTKMMLNIPSNGQGFFVPITVFFRHCDFWDCIVIKFKKNVAPLLPLGTVLSAGCWNGSPFLHYFHSLICGWGPARGAQGL